MGIITARVVVLIVIVQIRSRHVLHLMGFAVVEIRCNYAGHICVWCWGKARFTFVRFPGGTLTSGCCESCAAEVKEQNRIRLIQRRQNKLL